MYDSAPDSAFVFRWPAVHGNALRCQSRQFCRSSVTNLFNFFFFCRSCCRRITRLNAYSARPRLLVTYLFIIFFSRSPFDYGNNWSVWCAHTGARARARWQLARGAVVDPTRPIKTPGERVSGPMSDARDAIIAAAAAGKDEDAHPRWRRRRRGELNDWPLKFPAAKCLISGDACAGPPPTLSSYSSRVPLPLSSRGRDRPPWPLSLREDKLRDHLGALA